MIIHPYLERYGEKALSAPTKKGFNLTAWVTPFFAIIVGSAGIRSVVSRWVSLRKGEKRKEIAEQKIRRV
tara:strand:+ start:781 stop:990 length:210 start_codon:yes stop_codon:yes gene_type:complete